MRATRPLTEFLRSNAPLLAAVTFLAACDGVNEAPVGPTREHTVTPGPDRIAFVSERDGNSEIYIVDPDGTDLERLTEYGVPDVDPSWSRGGAEIAFERDGRIFTLTLDGSSASSRATGFHPAWSPTGSTLAFARQKDGYVSIATIGNAGAIRYVTSESAGDMMPSWSPDGSKIAFVSDYAVPESAEDIYTVNADGTDRRQLTQGSTTWPNLKLYLHPSWSPDGNMIAFVYGSIINGTYEIQSDSDMRFKIAVMSSVGVFIKDLAWAGDIPWLELLDPGSLSWSPDGLGIAYSFIDCDRVNNTSCTKERSVKYVSLDGTEERTIVKNGHSPSWSR